jgi:hypothetical protein
VKNGSISLFNTKYHTRSIRFILPILWFLAKARIEATKVSGGDVRPPNS